MSAESYDARCQLFTQIKDGTPVNATFDYDEYGNMTNRTVPGKAQQSAEEEAAELL